MLMASPPPRADRRPAAPCLPTAWQTLDRALTLILKIKSTWRVFKLLNIKHFSDIFINALFEDYKSFQKDDFLI